MQTNLTQDGEKPKRKAIGDKLRFEVFKRDQFKCQYCGKASPDVILHVDHINPVSKGGDNDILNLITSCQDCNSGKSDRLLSDTTTLDKQRKMLEELDERRKQLQMMLDWREELKGFDNEVAQSVADYFEQHIGGAATVNDVGVKSINKWLKRFEVSELLQAIDDLNPIYTKDKNLDASAMFENIPKVANFNRKGDAEKTACYIRGILRNRISYVDYQKSIAWLITALNSGVDEEELKELAKTVKNWTQFREAMEDILNG
ncbi:HNH endonuclease [Acinetobacter sp. CFCC 11171]|uniref:HNH endonuclease n=1 Tax=Acinetobacter sp. CFCC 11171 TaxID=1775558 RepID=UPI000DCFF469|nr:HNH endonuclease [Acinetobacter sp. CFCC 11171]